MIIVVVMPQHSLSDAQSIQLIQRGVETDITTKALLRFTIRPMRRKDAFL
jgi:hypothetical protein